MPSFNLAHHGRDNRRLMEKFARVFEGIDLFIGSRLGVTNLTGHPEISVVSGFSAQGQPRSLNLTGRLFGEEDLILLAHAYQRKTGHHLKRPNL